MGKKTLLFVDDGQIKVVFGDKLKCIKFQDAGLEHNKEFLGALLAKTTLVKVDKLTVVTGAELSTMLDEIDGSNNLARPQVVMSNTVVAGKDDLAAKRPAAKNPVPRPIQNGDTYIKSNSRATIIVDDLPTKKIISRPGMPSEPQSLVLEPGRPISLSSLDPEAVSKSRILARLLQKGDVEHVEEAEAMALLAEYDKQQAAPISAKEVGMASLLSSEDKAMDYLAKYSSGMPTADTIDISESNPRKGERDEDSELVEQILREKTETETRR